MKIGNLAYQPITPEPDVESATTKPSPGAPNLDGAKSDSPNQELNAKHSVTSLPQKPLDDPSAKAFLLQRLSTQGAIPSTRMEDRFGDAPETGGSSDGSGSGDSGSASGSSDSSSSASGSSDASGSASGSTDSSSSSSVDASSSSSPDSSTSPTTGDAGVDGGGGSSSGSSTTTTAVTYIYGEVAGADAQQQTTEANADESGSSSSTPSNESANKTNPRQELGVCTEQGDFPSDPALAVQQDKWYLDPQTTSDSPQLSSDNRTTVEKVDDQNAATEASKDQEKIDQWLDNNDDLRHHLEHEIPDRAVSVPLIRNPIIP